MPRRVPWPRILAEGVAIVVSILLAFAIQAWWEGRIERSAQADLFVAIRENLEENRAGLAQMVAANRERSEILSAFLAATPEELADLPEAEARAVFIRMLSMALHTPVGGAALSADASIIRLMAVRNMLNRWRGEVANFSENAPFLMERYMVAEELAGGAAMALRTRQAVAGLDLPVATIVSNWRRDEEFVAAQLRLERFVISSNGKGADLLGVTDEFLALLGGGG